MAIRIWVKTLTSERTPIEVNDKLSIGQAKAMIAHASVGCPPLQKQRLIFEGTELDDTGMLHDYHVKESDLLLVLRRSMMPEITRALWGILHELRELERAVVALDEYEEDLDSSVER